MHGFRVGQLQLADGDPGAGLGADFVRAIDLWSVRFVETVSKVNDERNEGVAPDSLWAALTEPSHRHLPALPGMSGSQAGSPETVPVGEEILGHATTWFGTCKGHE
jgi:hypothetical protein